MSDPPSSNAAVGSTSSAAGPLCQHQGARQFPSCVALTSGSVNKTPPLQVRCLGSMPPGASVLRKFEGSFAGFNFLPVSVANLTVARTACRLGAHFCPSDVDLPPRKNERFENLSHWDVTRATINKLYLGKHRSGVDLQAKLVDFCITLSGPTVRDVHNRLATANDPYSINHSSTSPLRYQPIAISIETNVRAGSEQESKAQLAVWATSHLKRLRLLSMLLGGLLIWRAIFTNGVNKPSLNFILNHLPELGQWLYDLVKPGSVLGRFPTTDGATKTPDAECPGMDNPYNGLVLQLPENRNAVVCQAQRVALTTVAILKMGRGKMPNRLDDVQLNASLRSDFDANVNPPSPTYISALHGGPPSSSNGKWFFINGIANEFCWFQRSCDKVRDTFNREVTGVYNRSDGILWNFIECCGERRAAEPNTLIESTQSCEAAQKALEQELRGCSMARRWKGPRQNRHDRALSGLPGLAPSATDAGNKDSERLPSETNH
ncbi:hypothetical protein MRS44_017831 [Fusarium solani]|uniref:uncharacterized protein n=1 Tax=Fusarium solani TaxID=169388 RepID=UPI0032C45D02|nr:hypothetical protein MRS44_017831 [Fusarium solani]